MDDHSPNLEDAAELAPAPVQPTVSRMSGERLVAVFVISIALGFIGTLIGFIPLIAVAMICPLIAASIP